MAGHKALMTIVAGRETPSLAEAAASLGVAVGDLNAAFGVVPIDRDKGLYAVEVDAAKLPAQDAGKEKESYRGPFSNPRIAPFGPPQTEPEDEKK